MHVLVHIHTLVLTEVEEEAVDFESACGFLILILHTEVKKQWTAESHDLLPEKVSDDPAARCLHTAVWHGHVRIPCRHCISLKNTHTHELLVTSHTQNRLSLVKLGSVSQLFCVNAS